MLRFAFQLLALAISVLCGSFAHCQQMTATIEDPDFISSDGPQELSNYLANLSGIAAMNGGTPTGIGLLLSDDPAVTIYIPVVFPGGSVVIIPIWIVTPVVTDKFPDAWPVEPNKKKIGYRWQDPTNPKGNGVRIDKGDLNSPFPSQQVDHVIVRSDGKTLGRDGKPI